MKQIMRHKFKDIISVENLLEAWQEFLCGKRNKPDVQQFYLRLMDNIFDLRHQLADNIYKHGGYKEFKINDPKPRTIHKAAVRDRLMHHAVYRKIYPFFDKKFIPDSYSCRDIKGTHKALSQFRKYARAVSNNGKKQCWILKCDIRKFFASIDQQTLIMILQKHINDARTINLLREIILSFKPNGLPLGNLTSQIFANVYLNELDQFVKHKLKAKYYIRYADDFVILTENKKLLENVLQEIGIFLKNRLKLELHPDKIFIKTIHSGVDFLGWVNFADCLILRASTKKRMFNRLDEDFSEESLNSYLGLLSHGNAKKLKSKIMQY